MLCRIHRLNPAARLDVGFVSTTRVPAPAETPDAYHDRIVWNLVELCPPNDVRHGADRLSSLR